MTLATQAAESLRRAIAGHLWRDFLPSERRLCDLLQVSRPTVRAALRQLASEGRIAITQGRRIRLVTHPAPARLPRSRVVALVSHQPLSQLAHTSFQGISEMRTQLARQGFRIDEFVCSGRTAATQIRRLETYLRQNRVLGCVLSSVSREVQQWLAAQKVPVLVLGSCHASVELPSLDVDYRAVCRHAAGIFRRHGHRQLAFLVPDLGIAGDLVSEAGFQEGASAPPGGGEVRATLVRHNGTPADLLARLGALFRSPSPPTALLVARPVHTIGVLAHLLRQGFRVPENLSLIARDHDPLYQDYVAHYAFADGTLSHRLSRLVLQMAHRGHLSNAPELIFPRYVARDTVRAPVVR